MVGETVITQEALADMQSQTFSKYLLDSTQLIETIQHFLRGEELNHEVIEVDGQKIRIPIWKRPEEREPPINEHGYHYLMKNLSPLMDKTTATGNISEESANNLLLMNMNGLCTGLIIHHEKFGLKDINDIDAIINAILPLLKIHFSKSINMRLVEEIFRTHHVSEIRDFSKEQKARPNMTI